MSKWKGKLARRIMAIVLSGAMVMSNMSAYATELTTETATEVIETVAETEESSNDVADDTGSDDAGNDAIISDREDTEAGSTDEIENDTDDTNGADGDAGTQETVDAPTNLKAEKEGENVKFSWTAVTKTDYDIKYAVSLKEKDATDAQEMLNSTEVTDASVSVATSEFTAEKIYTFRVKAVASKTGDSSGNGSIESAEATVDYTAPKEDSGDVTLSAPANLRAELNDAKDSVTVTWDSVSDAESYEITAKEQGEGATAEIKKNSNTTSVTFSLSGSDSLTRGKSYKFSVVAKKGDQASNAAETQDALTIPDDSEDPSGIQKYSVDVNTDIELAAADSFKADGANASRLGEKVGTKKGENGYFTMWYGDKAKVDTNSKSWADYNNTLGDDGKYPTIRRVNFGSKMDIQNSTNQKYAIEFTTENPAKVSVWWVANFASTDGTSKYRELAIQTIKENTVSTVTQSHVGASAVKNQPYKTTFRLSEAGTYYLGCLVGGNYVFKVEVEESETDSARKSWSEVSAPVTATPALKTTTTTDAVTGEEVTKTDASTIVVPVNNVLLDDDGGDLLTVTMTKDGVTEAAEIQKDAASKTEYSYEFKPTESGTYKFKATLSRLNDKGEDEGGAKESNEVSFEFTLPFTAPENLKAVDKSEGDKAAVELSWNKVPAADCYVVTVKEKDAAADAKPVFEKNDVTETKITIDTGLEREKTYIFSVQSKINATEGSEEQLTGASEVEFSIPKAPAGDVVEKKYVMDVGELYPEFTSTTPQADRTMAKGAVKRTEDNFFTIYYRNEGDGLSRIDVDGAAKTFSDGTTATHCINTGAAVNSLIPSSAIKFEIPENAKNTKVKLYWRGGSDGARTVGIKDKENNNVPDCSATSETTAKSGDPQYSEFTLTSAGTYYLGSLNGANRIYRVEVSYTAESQITVTDYTFNATTDLPDSTTDSEVIAAGTTYADGYFRTEGTVKSRIANPDTGLEKRAEVAKSSTGAFLFTVLGTADVEIEVSSTGATNYSMAGIVEKDTPDVIITNNEGKRFVSTLNKTKFTYKGLKSGTYKVVSPKPTAEDIAAATAEKGSEDKMSRSMFLYTIKVTETRTGDEEEKVRAEWPGTIAPPAITTVALDEADKGKINVTVNALIDYYEGGDEVVVYMDKKDAAEGDEGVKASSVAEKSEHVISFTPEASGTYVFRAELLRQGEEAKINAVETKELTFTLPLTKPHIKSATSKGRVTGTDSGSVELAWDEVKEATGYTIKYKEKDATDDAAVTIELDADKLEYLVNTGLEIGKTYVFTLTAKRAGTGENGADEVTEPSDESPVEITEESQITWAFSAYGDSTSTKTNGFTDKTHVGQNNGKDMPLGEVNQIDGKAEFKENENAFVRVWSMSGSGKIVPASVDGLAFYYTKINPNWI